MAERTLAQNVAQAINDFKAIKEALETYGSDDNLDGVPTSEYAGYVDGVAATAHSSGYEDGYAAGVEEGGGGDDEFWERFQQGGARTDYQYAFAGGTWGLDRFKPKYDLRPTSGNYMFYYCSNISEPRNNGTNTSRIVYLDLKAALEECGVVLDVSKSNANGMFQGSYITALPELDFSGASYLTDTFRACNYLKSIDKIILKDNASFITTFGSCYELESVTFEGTISKANFSITSTKLNKASIISIINCLSDATTGIAITLSKTAVNKAFATGTSTSNGSTSEEWLTLIATKSNWTITLS